MYMTDFAYDGPIFLFPLSLSYPSSPVLVIQYLYDVLPGWLSDVTGQYDAAFLVAGVWIAFSGLILMGIFLINCYDRRRHKADKSSHTSLQFQPKRASLRHIWKEDEHWIRQQPSSFPDIKVACTETVV